MNNYAQAPTTSDYQVNIPKKIPPHSSPTPPDYSRAGLTRYLQDSFAKYGIESQVGMAENVISCESGFQVNPKHNNISWGITQMTPATWKDFGYGNIMNPYSQISVMAKMWKMGLQSRWDCYRNLYN